MKQKLLTIITCLLLTVFTAKLCQAVDNTSQTYSIIMSSDKIELTEGEIDLGGDLMGKLDRFTPDPIEITTTSGGISIQFNANLGDVTVGITNAFGATVYSTIINSAVQTTLFIPTQNFPSGTYSITISNSNGSASGDFNI